MARLDKRIYPSERCRDGECAVCGRRHIHKDDCATLKRRQNRNDGTDPDQPPIPYAGGLLS